MQHIFFPIDSLPTVVADFVDILLIFNHATTFVARPHGAYRVSQQPAYVHLTQQQYR
jgi:hypothetical protein